MANVSKTIDGLPSIDFILPTDLLLVRRSGKDYKLLAGGMTLSELAANDARISITEEGGIELVAANTKNISIGGESSTLTINTLTTTVGAGVENPSATFQVEDRIAFGTEGTGTEYIEQGGASTLLYNAAAGHIFTEDETTVVTIQKHGSNSSPSIIFGSNGVNAGHIYADSPDWGPLVLTSVNGVAVYGDLRLGAFGSLKSNENIDIVTGNLNNDIALKASGNVRVDIQYPNKGFIIKSASSQTANLQEWQNGAGTKVAWIQPDGALQMGSNVVNGIYTELDLSTGYQHYIEFSQANDRITISSGNADKGGGFARFGANSGETRIFSNGNFNDSESLLTFHTLGVERMRIDKAGVTSMGTAVVNGPLYLPAQINPTVTEGCAIYGGSQGSGYSGMYLAGRYAFGSLLWAGDSWFGIGLTSGEHIRMFNSGYGTQFYYDVAVGAYDGNVNAQLRVTNDTASHPAVVIRGATSQTAKLTEWQNSSGVVVSSISPNGSLTAPAVAIGSATITDDVVLQAKRGHIDVSVEDYAEYGYSSFDVTVSSSADYPTNSSFYIDNENLYYSAYSAATAENSNIYCGPDKTEFYNAVPLAAKFLTLDYSGLTYRAEGHTLLSITASGVVINPNDFSKKALVVRGVASQTGNLQEWQNSSGVVLANIKPDGAVTAYRYFFNDGTSLVNEADGRIASYSSWGDLGSFSGARFNFYNYSIQGQIEGLVTDAPAFYINNIVIQQGSNGKDLNLVPFLDGVVRIGSESAPADLLAQSITTSAGANFGYNVSCSNAISAWGYYIYGVTGNVLRQGGEGEDANWVLQGNYSSWSVLSVRGGSGQSANLQEWQNSSGSALAYINGAGELVAPYAQFSAGGALAIKTVGSIQLDDNNGLNKIRIFPGVGGGIEINSNHSLLFGDTYNRAYDVGLVRLSSGKLQITNGSSGFGTLTRLSSDPFTDTEPLISITRLSDDYKFFEVSPTGQITTWGGVRTSNPITREGGAGTWLQFQDSAVFHAYGNTTKPTVAIAAQSSQTGNLQEWQDSTGATLSYVTPLGQFVLSGPRQTSNAYWNATNISENVLTFTETDTGGMGGFRFRSPLGSPPDLELYSNGRLFFSSYDVNILTNDGAKFSFQGDVLRLPDGGGGVMSGFGSLRTTVVDRPVLSWRYANNPGEWCVLVQSHDVDRVPLAIQGFSTQTANLTEWLNPSGVPMTTVSSTGLISTEAGLVVGIGGTYIGGVISVVSNHHTVSCITARAISGQSANIQEWQSSSGAVLTSISANGFIDMTPNKNDGSYAITLNLGSGGAHRGINLNGGGESENWINFFNGGILAANGNAVVKVADQKLQIRNSSYLEFYTVNPTITTGTGGSEILNLFINPGGSGALVLGAGTTSHTSHIVDIAVPTYFRDDVKIGANAYSRSIDSVRTINTTDATPTASSYGVGSDKVCSGVLQINALTDDSEAWASWEYRYSVVNNGGTTSAVIEQVGTAHGSNSGNPPSAWSVNIEDNDTTDSLEIEVTGAAATNIRWSIRISGLETSYS